MVTENGTVRTMEETLSDEPVAASEEQEEEVITQEPEETEAGSEEPVEEEKPEPYKVFSTHSEFQSEIDKAVNKHREVHEKDAELIRTLQEKEKDYRKQIREKNNNSEFKALFDADIADGMEESEAKKLDSIRKKLYEARDYIRDNADEIEEAAEIYSTIAKNMNQDYVKDWGLNDPNPHARAVNGANLINEAIGLHEANTIYKDVLEVLVTDKELREKMDNLVTELQGLSKDARKLRLEKSRDELKVTPASAPPKPKEKKSAGGLTHAVIAKMTPEEKWNRSAEIAAYYEKNPL